MGVVTFLWLMDGNGTHRVDTHSVLYTLASCIKVVLEKLLVSELSF